MSANSSAAAPTKDSLNQKNRDRGTQHLHFAKSEHSFVVQEFALLSIFALICRQSGVVTTLGAIGGDGLY